MAGTTIYRIRDWDRHFETSESRKRKSPLAWIGVPTKHDGRGFNRLKRHADWPALYGAWVLIVAIAAKCPTRGTLADADGPFTAMDISDKVDLPEELVQRCLDLLADEKERIQWIEAVSTKGDAATLADSASAPADSGRSQQTPADHAGTCCDSSKPQQIPADSGKSQSYITGQTEHYITEPNKTEPESARAPEPDLQRVFNPTASLITFPDGRKLDYHDDPMVWQAEFIRQWNALPRVSKHNKSQLTFTNQRALFQRLQDPDWDWAAAFKSFPLWMPGDQLVAMSWFLEEGSVNRILEGRHQIRAPVAKQQQQTIPDAYSFTEQELNSS